MSILNRRYWNLQNYNLSPYDSTTAAYLMVAYPAYWRQIREYGFANSELVPYINNDPDLICSLVDVGVTRWLVGDGVAYIDITNTFKTTDEISFEAIMDSIITIKNQYQAYAGAYNSNTSNHIINALWYNTNKTFFVNGWAGNANFITAGDILRAVINDSGCTLTNVTKSTYISSSNHTNSYPGTVPHFGVFAEVRTDGTLMQYQQLCGRFRFLQIGNKCRLVPCVHNGMSGMLDIVNIEWYGNANSSGSFTISETPAT